MPYIFVDDGDPESEEYADNYIWYDARSRESLSAALSKAREREGKARWAPAACQRTLRRAVRPAPRRAARPASFS